MDNRVLRYLRATSGLEAQHRLDELLADGDREIFPHTGISVHFSRLNMNRGIVHGISCAYVHSIYARLRVEML